MLRRITLFLIISMLCIVSACQRKEQQVVSMNSEGVIKEEEKEMETTLFVYVCGAVLNEGVYELPVGSRVYEAIEMAGGFLENAAVTEINQAEHLEDAMKIYVPTVEEILQQQLSSGRKVNLNRASKEELMTLPGIGEAKAESIIQYRKTHGSFRKAEDIMKITGIKESLYEKIKDFIQV